jgi:hypothetical protein
VGILGESINENENTIKRTSLGKALDEVHKKHLPSTLELVMVGANLGI